MTSATYHFSALPPSVNNAYATVLRRDSKGIQRPRRIKTVRNNTWANSAGWELLSQPRRRFRGRVAVRIMLGERGTGPYSDADNRVKAMLDLLVTHQVIAGDDSRYVRRVTVGWTDQIKGCRVRITEVRK